MTLTVNGLWPIAGLCSWHASAVSFRVMKGISGGGGAGASGFSEAIFAFSEGESRFTGVAGAVRP